MNIVYQDDSEIEWRQMFARLFDEFWVLDLLPDYLADADPNRALLDRRVVCDLLGFDEEVYRRAARGLRTSGAPSRQSTAARSGPRAQSK